MSRRGMMAIAVAAGISAMACAKGSSPEEGNVSSQPWKSTSPPDACDPGEREENPCGACDTGKQTLVCSAAHVFEPSGACEGVDTTIPVNPATGKPVCGPYDDAAVFISPHPDDETIGMAGAIHELLDQGRPVFIELMTHGEMSGVRPTLDNGGTDRWHPGRHIYKLTVEELGDARVKEFYDAAVRLGVTGVHVNGYKNGGLTSKDVAGRIRAWIERVPEGLSLRGTAGPQDPNETGKPHPDHAAVWEAMAASGLSDVEGYMIYHYTAKGGVPDEVRSISPWCPDKVDALDAYRVWDPRQGRYAIGAHSVYWLLQKAGSSCKEYVVYPGGAPDYHTD